MGGLSTTAARFQEYSSPTLVKDNFRVVRCSRRTPRLASSWATRRDSRDLGISSARPAAAKLPRATTSAKYRISFRSVIHHPIVIKYRTIYLEIGNLSTGMYARSEEIRVGKGCVRPVR